MDWVADFYSRTGQWWGSAEAAVTERDRRRVAEVRRLCDPSARKVLELGSGYGSTAFLTAESGYDVTACELSDRIEFADRFASASLRFVRGDFYVADLGSGYDVVTYWNGFGVGSDSDQRRLLSRIATDWLKPNGKALIDVGNPFVRAKWDGDFEHRDAKPLQGYAFTLDELTTYDPVHNRFIDTWWQAGDHQNSLTQSLRNYTPADLRLLLEGTGMQLDAVHLEGTRIDLDIDHRSHKGLLVECQEYLAELSVGQQQIA